MHELHQNDAEITTKMVFGVFKFLPSKPSPYP